MGAFLSLFITSEAAQDKIYRQQ